jgi:multiple antibiotic resistance protein
MTLWNSFFLAFSALLPLINPVGSALVFLGLVGEASPATYRSLARRIAINTVIFLAVIELLGSALLNFFGISLPIVQLAGGLVVAAIGWSLLNEKDTEAVTARQNATAEDCAESAEAAEAVETAEKQAREPGREPEEDALSMKTFYPFTFPITAGPGTIVVMLTLSAHASSHVLAQNVLGHVGVFLASIVLCAMVYPCYAYAPALTRAISPNTAHGVLRVIAFILLCIGVQIAWNGLSTLIPALHAA